jgi:adenosylhomocysteinase
MDMSFANQALGVERLVTHRGQLPNQLMALPDEVDDTIARLKLASMGIAFDTLTPDQEAYMSSWDMGTQ